MVEWSWQTKMSQISHLPLVILRITQTPQRPRSVSFLGGGLSGAISTPICYIAALINGHFPSRMLSSTLNTRSHELLGEISQVHATFIFSIRVPLWMGLDPDDEGV